MIDALLRWCVLGPTTMGLESRRPPLGEHIWCKPQLRQNLCKPRQKIYLNSPKKNHTCRWYIDIQFCKISYPNSTSFVRYKNNKFLTNYLDNFLAWNLFFYISQRSRVWTRYFIRLCIIISSRCVNFFYEFRRFFAVVCTDFHEVVVCTRYVPFHKWVNGSCNFSTF